VLKEGIIIDRSRSGRRILMLTAIMRASTTLRALFFIACAVMVNM